MKMKMKFDVASIKSWLLAHGEKVAFGVVGLLFLMFVYSAFQLESLESNFEPAKLEQLATSVKNHVSESKWDAKRENVQVVSYSERAKVKTVPVGTYPLAMPWNPRVTDPKAKRTQPDILPAEDLRVAAGMDIFALKSAQGGNSNTPGGLQAQPWAVITGVVPLQRQRQIYHEIFAEALDFSPERDQPTYLRPVVERAVVDPANPNQLNWEPVPDATAFVERWPATKSDIVAAKFVLPNVTAPLGELVGSQWGESVTHPKIPLLADTVANPTTGPQPQPGMPASGSPTTSLNTAAATNTAATSVPADVEYALLRVFDYGVQPGRKYRYRLSLVLNNPNSASSPQTLQDPAIGTAPTLASPVTEPTPLVSIPDGHDILAGVVDPGTRYTEPTAKIAVTAIDISSGLKAATELEAHRGTMANSPPREVLVMHPQEKKVVKLTLPFRSNMVVLDIYGGGNLVRRRDNPIHKPAEVLLLDAAGNMTVRSELDDLVQYQSAVVREETPPPPRAQEEAKPKPTIRSKK